MEGIYIVIAEFMVDAGKLACFIGLMSYCINIFYKACTGKEVIL